MPNEIRQVIILGAGASRSEGIPLQRELISRYLRSRRHVIRAHHRDFERPFDRTAIEYLEEFWGLQLGHNNNRPMPTFEECMGILDLAEMRSETYRNYEKQDIVQNKQALICAMAQILEESSRGRQRFHTILVNRLAGRNLLRQTAFISLNYDLKIDKALMNLWPNHQLDYGIEFANFGRPGDWVRPDDEHKVILIKLHGSLNWRYCPTCSCIELIGDPNRRIIQLFEGEDRCQTCNATFEPILVPPTFFKDMANPFLQQIFLKADEVLRNCERIFFCGYSFPDADMHIKYLLKRAEMYREQRQRIYVINEHGGKRKSERDQERKRFKRFYRNSENIEFTRKSFEQFCHNGHRRMI